MLGEGEGLTGAFFLQPCASLDVRHRSHSTYLVLRIRDLVTFLPRDPGWVKSQDPYSG